MTRRGEAGTAPARVLYAIGTSTYTDPDYAESEQRVQEQDSLNQSIPRSLAAVVEALRRHVQVMQSPNDFLLNPPTSALRRTLAKASSTGDIVIIYYTGHGEEFGADGYFLITTDFTKKDRLETGVKAAALPELVVKRRDNGDPDSQQPPILLILDCCFSGAGGIKVLRDAVLGGPNPNLWVWATASKTQYATSGRFAEALATFLRQPTVGASTEYIPLESVLDEIDDALHGTDQRAEMYSRPGFSTVPKFFPNSNFVAHVAGLTVAEQHWVSKARGGPDTADPSAGFYLTGRTGRVRAATDLANWITNPAAGNLAVVLGSPGTGKSALLSLPVLLADPASRTLLLDRTPDESLAHLTAGLIPDHTRIVAVHARGLNIDQVASAIAAGLGRPATGAATLLDSLDDDPPRQAPVVIIDALDEASAPPRLRDNLLLPLAVDHRLRVILGARSHVARPDWPIPATDINLDSDYSDPEALVDYVDQLLAAAREPEVRSVYENVDDSSRATVARAIAARATSKSGPDGARIESFLIARAIALAVREREEPVDTTVAGWTEQLPDGFAEAFTEDLDRLVERNPAARVLLEALGWARGPGLPWERIWVPVARALARRYDVPGPAMDDDDVRWLLDRAGAYIVEDRGASERSVFRPFHDRLAEHLRAQTVASGVDTANVEAAIVEALLGTLGPPSARRWDRAHPYLRTYLGEHALAAGSDVFSALLGDSGFLAAADPATLTPKLSNAAREHDRMTRSYRRARPLLGGDPAMNAAYLAEAALAFTGISLSFAGTGLTPSYRTTWARVRPDHSVLAFTPFTGQHRHVSSIAFGTGAGGRPLLAIGGIGGSARLWDPDSGEPVGPELAGLIRWVQVAFGAGAGGRPLLATGGVEGTVRLWDLDSGVPVRRPLTGDIEGVHVAFGAGAGGRPLLATGGDDDTVRLWDPDTGEPLGPELRGPARLVSVAFGAGAGACPLLAAGGDGVRLWDLDTGEPVGRELSGHTRHVSSVAFGAGAGGRPLLATAGEDGARLWDLDTGKPVGPELTGHTQHVSSVAFGTGAGGRPLLASGGDGVRIWIPDTGEPVGPELTGHTQHVSSVAFGTGAGGRPLLASGGDGVRIWDPDTDEPVGQGLTGPGDLVSVAFGAGAGGRPLLATGGDEGSARLWDVDTGEPLGPELTGHTAMVSVAFGTRAGGRPLLATAGGGTVRLWDPDTGKPAGPEITGRQDRLSVAFGTGAGGRPLLATGAMGTVRLWDPDTGEPVGPELTGHRGWVSVAFGTGAGGRPLLAAGGFTGIVRLWDPDSGEPAGPELTGHTGRVSVAFATGAHGRPLLVTSSFFDCTVRLWEPDSGENVTTIRRRSGPAAIATSGSRLAIGDEEGLSVIDIG